MHEGGISGTRKQILLSAILSAAVFVVMEYLERFAAGTGSAPSAQLLLVGIYVQVVVGLLCLGLARLTPRAAARVIRSTVGRKFPRTGGQAGDAVLRDVTLGRPLGPMGSARAGRAWSVSRRWALSRSRSSCCRSLY